MSNYRTSTDDGLRSINLRPEDPREVRRQRRRKSRTKTTLLILAACILLLLGGVALVAYHYTSKLDNIDRFQAFRNLPEENRPKKPTGAGANALNILLAGSDARTNGVGTTGKGKGDAWRRGGQRTDTIMLLHITSDRRAAYLISFPRDSWVDIGTPDDEYGINKINAAYSFGGPPLYIQTIESLTGLRIDHIAVIDWTGFMALTDALGGVEMTFDESTRFASGKVYEAGTHNLSGEEALDYVRERKSLPGGDFDRMARQQNFLRSLMRQTLSNGTLTNPVKLSRALEAITQNLSVDENFTTGEMRGLAVDMRGLRSSNVTFMTVPTKGTGMEGTQSVVYLDEAKCKSLFQAIRADKIDRWLAKNGKDNVLGRDVN